LLTYSTTTTLECPAQYSGTSTKLYAKTYLNSMVLFGAVWEINGHNKEETLRIFALFSFTQGQ